MKLCLFVCSLVALVVGCTYSPVDDYYKQVKKPDLSSPKYSITLDTYKDGDTIYLYGSPDFHYTLQLASGTLIKAEVTLGNSLVYTGYSLTDAFNLQYYLKTGIFELKIQYTASSGTGSLADVTGSEQVQVWKKWILKIDVDPPPPVNVKASIVNGYLRFTWTKYSKPNFVSYNLRYSRGTDLFNSEITDPNKTYWIDSTYMWGEVVQCQVYTQGYNTGELSTAGVNKVLGFASVNYNAQDSIAKISWTKTPYLNALKQYDVYVDNELQRSFSNASDSSFSVKINPGYGISSEIEIIYKSKYPDTHDNTAFRYVQSISNTVATKNLPRNWTQLSFNRTLNEVVAINRISLTNMIYRYDVNLNLVDSVTLNNGSLAILMPYSGTTIYYSEGVPSYFYYQDLLVKHEYSQQVYISDSGPGPLAVSGNGVFCYSYFASAGTGYIDVGDAIINLNTNTYLYNYSRVLPLTSSFKGDAVSISDDGANVRINDTFYNVNAGSTSPVGTLAPGSTFFGYRSDNPTEVLISTSTGLEVRNASDLSLKRTIQKPLNDWNYVLQDYDPVTKNLVFTNGSSVYLINVDTQQQRALRINQSLLISSRFLNGYFFSGRNYIKL